MEHCTSFVSLVGRSGGSDTVIATSVSSVCLLHQSPGINIPGRVLYSVSEHAWHRMRDDINMEITVYVCVCLCVCE